jgi:alpha-amylase
MDYETFGEHQWAETGIFDFLAHLPQAVFDVAKKPTAPPRTTSSRPRWP